MISVAQFRRDQPSFQDDAAYPESRVEFWLSIAALMLTARWGSSAADPWPSSGTAPTLKLYDYGTELFVAHNLTLEARDNLAVAAGGLGGESTGPVSNKGVDKVSVGYDTASAMEAGAGHWALTTFGLRFVRLSRMVGAGPIQIC